MKKKNLNIALKNNNKIIENEIMPMLAKAVASMPVLLLSQPFIAQ